MKKGKITIHFGIRLLVCISILAAAVFLRDEGQAFQKPVRLGLYPEKPNINIGESTALIVKFRDLDNNFVENDRNRSITINVEPSSQGKGTISPNPMDARPGMKESRVSFRAEAGGVVILRAQSPGLESTNTSIGVRSRSSGWREGFLSLLKALITPLPSHAQPPQSPGAQLSLNLALDKVPANAVTPVSFFIYLSRPLADDQELSLQTEGAPVQIRIDGKANWSTQIRKGDIGPVAHSLELIPGMEVGWTTIIATAYPSGIRVRERIELTSPKPAGLLVDVSERKLVSRLLFSSDSATIDVKLVDSHKGRVLENNKDRVVSIDTGHSSVIPKDSELKIQTSQIQNSTILVLSKKLGLPDKVKISVRDKGGSLEGDDVEVQILAVTILLLVSGFGGVSGGILRYGLKEQQKSALPSQANPGLVVNILLSTARHEKVPKFD